MHRWPDEQISVLISNTVKGFNACKKVCQESGGNKINRTTLVNETRRRLLLMTSRLIGGLASVSHNALFSNTLNAASEQIAPKLATTTLAGFTPCQEDQSQACL